ncbi:synembryn-A-like [Arapaima gigas]
MKTKGQRGLDYDGQGNKFGDMDVDLEEIIWSIEEEDQEAIVTQLQKYNDENALCFFFDTEERERRKQRELEEFRRNKVRDYVPDSDSDSDGSETPDLFLRQRLAAALIQYVGSQRHPQVLKACLRTLRILSRDRRALDPLLTDPALLTLAKLGGIGALPVSEQGGSDTHHNCGTGATGFPAGAEDEPSLNARPDAAASLFVEPGAGRDSQGPKPDANSETRAQQAGNQQNERDVDKDTCSSSSGAHARRNTHECLVRGKRDSRAKGDDEEDKEEGEVWRKEAMKALCNVVYNSNWAQKRASELSFLPGLLARLARTTQAAAPPSGQFYELRLLFLLTALRPELRAQLQKEGGVSLLTAALEKCLSVQWRNLHEAVLDPTVPPISTDVSQRAIEILKILFSVTYSNRKQQLDNEGAALYRHLAAVLRHCLLLSCEKEECTEELQSHVVNLLSVLPLHCLDVLLSVPLSEGSLQCEGFNMDCVHALMLFMEKQLNKSEKLKERLTPVLSLLTESCRAHRQTRHYLRQQILPPLRDVSTRPEEGESMKSRLVRLMTHVDTDVKDCAAELLFVLCKENVRRFVKYTGYGNAAGLLAARGLLRGRGRGAVPEGRYSSDSDSDTEEYKQAKAQINPVTGRVEADQPDPMEGMTEEEKEEEAQKLINMFNKLSRNKIIEPVVVSAEGKLVPLEELRHDTQAEDGGSEEDSEEQDK